MARFRGVIKEPFHIFKTKQINHLLRPTETNDDESFGRPNEVLTPKISKKSQNRFEQILNESA